MSDGANWIGIERVFTLPEDAIDAAVEEFSRAAGDMARCAAAEAVATGRVAALRALLDQFSAAQERANASEAEALQAALAALRDDLASLEQTLPLERAFHADERDRARARMALARAQLRAAMPG